MSFKKDEPLNNTSVRINILMLKQNSQVFCFIFEYILKL
ncbi:hypothetical protein AsAng_0001270 [Aureispira anguillae]|uniref:Uncharacterized protein n=1 Tax=Aureispira anguillae TaxID=2864201 RepID=A0A915VMP0_9BACT|nr:hypothetical protein AsAng_0001270 [Aureispira anguillae]